MALYGFDKQSLEGCDIVWNEELDTKILSHFITGLQHFDVLEVFFSFQSWDDVYALSKALITKEDFFSQESEHSLAISKETITVYTQSESLVLSTLDFYKLVQQLFYVLIEGAVEHHHTVRYANWWEDFTLNYEHVKATVLAQ